MYKLWHHLFALKAKASAIFNIIKGHPTMYRCEISIPADWYFWSDDPANRAILTGGRHVLITECMLIPPRSDKPKYGGTFSYTYPMKSAEGLGHEKSIQGLLSKKGNP